MRGLVERIVDAAGRLPELQDELRIAEYKARRPAGRAEDHASHEQAASRLRSAEEELASAVRRLDELGVQLKDPATGLVDFLSYRDGELVELCWKLGEERVAHWHRIGEGYAGRKPL